MRTKNILLIFGFLLVGISAFNFTSIGGTGLTRISNNLVWASLSLLLGFSFICMVNNRKVNLPATYNLLILGLFFSVMPFFISSKAYLANGYFLPLGLLGGVLFYFSLFQYNLLKKKPEYILYVILGVGVTQIGIGFYQTVGALLYNLSTNSLSFDPAPLGSFAQKNLFATYMASCLLIAGWIIHKECYVSKNDLLVKTILYTLSFLATFLIVFSNSRAGYLGAVVGLVVTAPYYIQLNKKEYYKWVAVILAALLFAATCLSLTEPVPKEFSAGGARVGIYVTSLHIISDAPFFGHGLGSFEPVFANYFPEVLRDGHIPKSSWAVNLSHPHNELLLWGIEGGVVSILGLLLMSLAIVKSRIKNSCSIKRAAKYGLLIPIFLHSMVELPFEVSSIHYLTFISLLFFLTDGNFVNYKVKTAYLSKLMSVGSALIISMLFLINAYSLHRINKFLLTEGSKLESIDRIPLSLGWSDEYNSVYKGTLMNIGIVQNEPSYILDYIRWARGAIERAPKIEYYQNIIVGYHQLGEFEKAKSVLSEMLYMYPNNKKQKWVEGAMKKINSNG